MKRFILIACGLLAAACAKEPPERKPDPPANSTAQVLITGRPAWLFPADACPADVMPHRFVQVRYVKDACTGDPERCKKGCEAGSASDCFALALAIEPLVGKTPVVDALFLRSCALGAVPGCTNRAANMSQDRVECQVRTYDKACDLMDPWACSVLGMYLARGIGIEQDLERARIVSQKSCDLVDDDTWCSQQVEQLAEIDQLIKAKKAREAAQAQKKKGKE